VPRGTVTASVGPVLRHPGIHAALGDSAAEAAKEVDPRVKWMALGGQMEMAEAQRISDEQPHAKSLAALAGRAERREKLFVSPWRVLKLLPAVAVPQWLEDLDRRGDPDIGPRPAVVVGADDTVRPAPFGTVAAW